MLLSAGLYPLNLPGHVDFGRPGVDHLVAELISSRLRAFVRLSEDRVADELGQEADCITGLGLLRRDGAGDRKDGDRKDAAEFRSHDIAPPG